MKCTDCPHFKIRYRPIKGWDSGMAACEKHDLVCEYMSTRQLNRLECVESKNGNDEWK